MNSKRKNFQNIIIFKFTFRNAPLNWVSEWTLNFSMCFIKTKLHWTSKLEILKMIFKKGFTYLVNRYIKFNDSYIQTQAQKQCRDKSSPDWWGSCEILVPGSSWQHKLCLPPPPASFSQWSQPRRWAGPLTMARVTALVLSLALAAASSNTHKNIADTLRQFMTGYFRHYRAGYYVDDFISSDNECQRHFNHIIS